MILRTCLFLVFFTMSLPWQAEAVPAEIDSKENQTLVFSSLEIDALKKTAKAVQLSLYWHRDKDLHSLLIRCKTDHENPATQAEIKAFRTECIKVVEGLATKLKGQILSVSIADIRTDDHAVCHYLWTTHDLVCVVPLRFAEKPVFPTPLISGQE